MQPRFPTVSPCDARPAAGLLLAVALQSMLPGCDDGPPPPPEVTLSPPTPTTTDDLVLGIAGRDPSEAPGAYRIRWMVDGQAVAELAGAREVPAALTAKGDTWKAVVVAVDTDGQTSEPGTASVTVTDTPPTAALSVSPAEPRTADDLVLAIAVEDADHDEVTVDVRWSVDGVLVPAWAGRRLIPASDTARGQTLEAVAVPDDGEQTGPASRASVVVANTPPAVTSVVLGPDAPREGDTLHAVATTADADGDAVTASFAWYLGEALLPVVGDDLDSTAWDEGDVVRVVVTPDDGTHEGLPVACAPVTVAGTPPSITGVAVAPATGGEATVFTCTPVGWSDPDPADAEGYGYTWTVDDVVVATTATLSGASFDKDDVIACTATPDDGHLSGIAHTSAGVVVVNTPPAATSATISPPAPREADTVTVTVTGWSDPDPLDVEGYHHAWYAGADLRGAAATLTGAAFDKGDALHVVVTPWDGTEAGPAVTSDPVTAANTPPVATSVALTPDDPAEGDTLTAVVQTSDADGDPVTPSFAWFVNGLPATGQGATLDASAWDEGDVVHVEVTPDDGTDAGSPVASETVTVRGSPPAITGVAIDPATGGETTTFACVPQGWSDPDPADTDGYLIWTWTVDGVVVDDGESVLPLLPDPLDGAAFDKGDVIACTLTPGDDDGLGAPRASDGVTVANTPPSIAGVTITPNRPREVDTVEAVVDGWSDPDPADQPGYEYAWFVGSQGPNPTPVATTATLTGAHFDRGQKIVVVVTPWDGTDAGAAVSSGDVWARNTAPVATSVVVAPATLYTDTSATAVVSGWYDPDPADHEGYWYDWSVQWNAVGHEATLHHSAFDRGDEVIVFATPDDGYELGPSLSAGPFIVQNRPPTAPTVRVVPAEPLDGEALMCDLELPSTDADDDDLVYELAWLRDGLSTPWFVTAATADADVEVPAGETGLGEVWTCAATADDGYDPGPTASAAVRVSCGPNEIPTGMVGIDGCLPLSDAFPTIGYTFECPYVPFTESTDGDTATVTLGAPGEMLAYRYGSLPSNTTGSRMVFEIEPLVGEYFDELSVWIQDDWTTCGTVIRAYEAFFSDGNHAVFFPVPTGLQTYELRILPGEGGVELLIDGVSVGVLPGGRQQGTGAPMMFLLVRGGHGSGVRIDHLSYTPGP